MATAKSMKIQAEIDKVKAKKMCIRDSPYPSFGGYALDRSALWHYPQLLGCAIAAPGIMGGRDVYKRQLWRRESWSI